MVDLQEVKEVEDMHGVDGEWGEGAAEVVPCLDCHEERKVPVFDVGRPAPLPILVVWGLLARVGNERHSPAKDRRRWRSFC